MKSDGELKIIMLELQDWLSTKDLTILEATSVLESIKLALNLSAFEKTPSKAPQEKIKQVYTGMVKE